MIPQSSNEGGNNGDRRLDCLQLPHLPIELQAAMGTELIA